MKKIILITILTMGITTSNSTGVPVIDGKAISNQIKTWIEETKRWKEQANQYKQDYQNQLRQLAAQTGSRDVVGFMKEAKSAYKDVQNLQELVQNPSQILEMGKSALSGELQEIYNSYGMFNSCEEKKESLGETRTKTCEGEVIALAQTELSNRKVVQKMQSRILNIEKIADRMANAKDVKEAQDLSNAMQTQIALLQSDKILQDAQLKTEQQALEIIRRHKKQQSEDAFYIPSYRQNK